MKLDHLLADVPVTELYGSREVEVKDLTYRSDRSGDGSVFFAWRGEKIDGHQFIPGVVSRGASAIVVERNVDTAECTRVLVPSSRRALSLMSANFYSRPAEKLNVVGITGTNGKTSTAFLIKHFLTRAGRIKTGLVGTVQYELGEGPVPADRTTPEGLEIQEYLYKMVQSGCGAAVMEVSSHALDQGRVEGIPYRVAVFTNLSQDHLDYHGTMEVYFGAKLKMFASLRPGQIAVINHDDPCATQIKESLTPGVGIMEFGLSPRSNFYAEDIECAADGTTFTLRSPEGPFEVKSSWVGNFNVYNILAAFATGSALGLGVEQMVEVMEDHPSVPGRMERVKCDRPYSILVDYAHTDDAVRKALQALRPLTKNKLWVVVGCGGNRDKAKRPLMARAACELADEVVFTSDNPRDEEPLEIIHDMIRGVGEEFDNFTIEVDRAKAIETAIHQAEEGDVILIAGKGHENTQEIKGVKINFSDQQIATRVVREKETAI